MKSSYKLKIEEIFNFLGPRSHWGCTKANYTRDLNKLNCIFFRASWKSLMWLCTRKHEHTPNHSLRCLNFVGDSLSLIVAEACPHVSLSFLPCGWQNKLQYCACTCLLFCPLNILLLPDGFSQLNAIVQTTCSKTHFWAQAASGRKYSNLNSNSHCHLEFLLKPLQVCKHCFYLFCDLRRKVWTLLTLFITYFMPQPSDILEPFRMRLDGSVLYRAQKNILIFVEETI